MNTKKNIVNYIFSGIFAVVCIIGIVLTFYNDADFLLYFPNVYVALGVVVVAIILLLMTCVLYSSFLPSKYRGICDNENTRVLLTVFWGVVSFAAVAVRIYFYLINKSAFPFEEEVFYQNALVTDRYQVLDFYDHGCSNIYLRLLHYVFMLVGNNPTAAIGIQIMLLFVCLLVVYFMFLKLGKQTWGTISVLAIGMLPDTMNYISHISPELFYITLYLIALFWIVSVGYKLQNDMYKSSKSVFRVLPLGIYLGFMLYMDLLSVTLLFFVIALLFAADNGKKSGLFVLITVISSLLGVLVVFLCVQLLWNIDIITYVTQYAGLYFSNIFFEFRVLYPESSWIGNLALLGCGVLILPAVIGDKRANTLCLVLSVISLELLTLFQISYMDYGYALTVLWCLLSAYGVSYTLCPFEYSYADYAFEKSEDEEVFKQLDMPDAKKDLKERRNKNKTKSAETKNEKTKSCDKASDTSENNNQTNGKKPEPGKPFSNPMPIPKRERKELDYKYLVPQSKMKFDFDVKDDDDFDH